MSIQTPTAISSAVLLKYKLLNLSKEDTYLLIHFSFGECAFCAWSTYKGRAWTSIVQTPPMVLALGNAQKISIKQNNFTVQQQYLS